jgi:hypothetical protein
LSLKMKVQNLAAKILNCSLQEQIYELNCYTSHSTQPHRKPISICQLLSEFKIWLDFQQSLSTDCSEGITLVPQKLLVSHR